MTGRAALGLGVAAVLAAAALQVPAVPRLLPPCPVEALTGLHCPGCGTGRALLALGRGDLAAAAGHNPLLAVTLPLIGGLVLGEWRARRRREPFLLPRWTVGVVAGLFAVFTVARNLPGFGFLGP